MKRTITLADLAIEWTAMNGIITAVHVALHWPFGLPIDWNSVANCALISGVTLCCVWRAAEPEDTE